MKSLKQTSKVQMAALFNKDFYRREMRGRSLNPLDKNQAVWSEGKQQVASS